VGIGHWDEVEKRRNERGQMAGSWSNLGTAAGSYRCGVHRIELGPGEMPTPAHVHGESEEIFYVLAGSGLTWMNEKAYEIRAGDCIVYKNFHEAHRIRAGEGGLDVLAFGPREYLTSSELPRGGSMWSITGWIEVHDGHPWDREPELEWPEPERERAATIVATQDVEGEIRKGRHDGTGRGRRLALDGAEAHRARARHALPPAALPLGRGGALRRARRRRHTRAHRVAAALGGAGSASGPHGLRRRASAGHRSGPHLPRRRVGDDVARRGTRDPNDICWYPRSKKIFWRGVGVIGRIEQLDYWDGEELE